MIFLQQHVGFLILLAFLVRFADILTGYLQAKRYGWAIAYAIVAFLLLLAALLALGFHA